MLDTKVVDPDLSDTEARDAGELVERGRRRDPKRTSSPSPHGGDIEEHTDEQANGWPSVSARSWPARAGKGWRPGGGASVRWHITSTDLNPVCFPLLNSVMSRRFAHAVAFHGYNDEGGHRRDGARRSEGAAEAGNRAGVPRDSMSGSRCPMSGPGATIRTTS